MSNGQGSPFKVGFWPIVCAILVLLIEPAVWTLVGGLSHLFLVSIVVVGALAFLMAILSENIPNYTKPLKRASVLLVGSLIVLAGYAFLFRYQSLPGAAAQTSSAIQNSIGTVKDNRGIITQGQSGGTNIINPNPNGTITTYDFGGTKHVNNPAMGKFFAEVGEETNVYSRMVELQKKRRWQELVDVCEPQIKKTPEWLTPYEFAGVAYGHLGNTPKAIELLTYVKEHAGDRPEYAEVDRLLKFFSTPLALPTQ